MRLYRRLSEKGRLRCRMLTESAINCGNGGWEWCTDNPLPSWGTAKTIHDPCPAGWRVPQKSELKVLVDRNATAIPKVRRMMVEYCLIMMIQATSFIYGLPDILL